MFRVPEQYRVTQGKLATKTEDGNNGCFYVISTRLRYPLTVIASDGGGWEHVSVSLAHRCPTWAEMCRIKDLFWGSDDLVVQFHPSSENYVNDYKYTLHLWRKSGTNDFCDTPPKEYV